MKQKRKSYRAGVRFETLACWYLRLRCWRIIKRRWRSPLGEIDIIAKRGGSLIFVEVKFQGKLPQAAGAPIDKNADKLQRLERISPAQLKRLRAASELWLARNQGIAKKVDSITIDAMIIGPRFWNIHYQHNLIVD